MEAKTDADIVGTLWTVAIACLGCVALGSAVAFAVAQSVVRPATELRSRRQSLEETCLASLSCSLTAIGKGDFTVGAVGSTTPIESPSQDELGQTCAVFNAMLARIHAAIADLNHARSSLIHAVTGIRVCARQVWSDDAGQGAGVADSIKQVTLTIAESAHTSQDMAAGSEALASTASEAASNMEEMDRAIEEMSGLASRVLGEASSALEDARKGEQSLSELVAALEQISGQTKSSMAAVLKLGEQQEKIGAIVNTIEEISDQTNLLALNAAIEAARAGQHERGFAVVAEEVRKLAERAGSSTKEITDLIGTIRMGVERTHAEMTASVRAVVQGREVGVQASSALARIAEAASTVRALSEDAQSQAKGLAESAQSVSGLVTQVASISQESAAGTEQISSGFHEIAASATQVSGDLSSAAEELTSLVNAFTVEKESRLMLAA